MTETVSKESGDRPGEAPHAQRDPIFEPLRFRNLTVKNRVFRSSISGRIDNYNGSGTPARVNWEGRFADGGIGAIISAHVPVHVSGRILPNYAHIDDDDKIPFWATVGDRVHESDCAFILQLSHGGRQRDIAGVENAGTKALSSTDRPDPIHGIPCRQMSTDEIADVVQYFAQGARRARAAGLDGVELHACNGYLFTQFLSSGINTRTDDYGGSLRNRARLLLEALRAVRAAVGDDFHVQVKISGVDHNRAFLPWTKPGNRLEESVQVCRWVEEEGADAIHVSTGSFFPHPRNPAGDFLTPGVVETYDTMLSSGTHTLRNYLFFRFPPTRPVARAMWRRTLPPSLEGLNLADAAEIRRNVSIPVLCAGGFQTASTVRRSLREGNCDGVTIARPLMANPDLVKTWQAGHDEPERPCTYCNRCLFHVIEDPLGCYDLRRFDGDQARMTRELMAFYEPDGFGAGAEPVTAGSAEADRISWRTTS
jgi:2,4-dienoyl-CoA reductase-like NADH-dependent reductase (Old Yellow Enzyme family)